MAPLLASPPRTLPPRLAVRQAFGFNVLLAVGVWCVWGLVGGQRAFAALALHWKIALTMIPGSMVGGGTSEGGAAVAFPVFTKVLHIPAGDARLFSFAIQTVGMGAATLSILYQRIRLETRVLGWCGVGGVLGVVLSTYLLVPRLPPVYVRIFFTAMVTSLAAVLLWANSKGHALRHMGMPRFQGREKLLLFAAGVLGGALSGLIGCGENIVVFMVMVVLFRVDERVVTPTTVVLMWMVTALAFLLHLVVLRDIPPRVIDYWLAAVPIVVVGAPFGALLCSRLSREVIVGVLVVLIAVEFLSTLLLVDLRHGVWVAGLGALAFFGILNVAMYRSKRYITPLN